MSPTHQSAPSKGCARGACRRFGWLVLVFLLVVLVGALWWRAREPHRSAPPGGTTPGATAPVAAADFGFLQGRWVRPDGGYVLEIRGVDAAGQMQAGYFNPQPIRVSDARVVRDAGAVKVFVELNDVNYPGCKYNLTYIPDRDILVGTYYQAALRQTYEVGFERLP